MNRYIGWIDADGKIFGVTDGCGCYDDHGNCVCAECYYYGSDRVNCANARATKDSKPVKLVDGHWELDGSPCSLYYILRNG